ncbi:MAG: GDP-mannose 4,6-dehydratase [bacterium]
MSRPGPIVVTGALGFVAGWLITELLASGERVVGLSLIPTGQSPPEQAGPFRRLGDDSSSPGGIRYGSAVGEWTCFPSGLDDPAALERFLRDWQPATVYHLAAQSSAGYSFPNPQETFSCNLGGSLNLLEAIRALPDRERPTLLATGSSEEYGPHAEGKPLHERMRLKPVSPYGVSKAAQSLLCLQYHRSFDLPIIVTRPFSHTGPHHDGRFVFPSFAQQIVAIERGEAAPVIAVGDLSPRRDYLDVRDVVTAYRQLVASGEPGQIYNICSGQALTIQGGLEILLQEARRKIDIATDPDRCRPSDIPYLVGDGTKLRACTGWRPERDFHVTLREMLDWVRKEHS